MMDRFRRKASDTPSDKTAIDDELLNNDALPGKEAHGEPPQSAAAARVRFFRRWVWIAVSLTLAIHVAGIGSLRWIDPKSSAFIRRDVRAVRRSGSTAVTRHSWTDLSRISRSMQLAVIAAEDQKFPMHFGFDVTAIREAMDNETGRPVRRGASTITQQAAKNLFLWPSRSLLRKGMEAYYTVWMELLLPKDRILEIYLNIAQFDDHIFGAEAASRYFFGRSAATLTRDQAALLAAVLPNPRAYAVEAPSPYLLTRAAWIENQMAQLGESCLDGL